MITIDRFEGGFAVCENKDGEYVNIPVRDLPPDVREGDLLRLYEGKYIIERGKTEERREMLSSKMKNIWKNKKGR